MNSEPDADSTLLRRAARLKAIWRKTAGAETPDKSKPGLRLGIAASFTANSFVPFIGAPLVEMGLSPTITVGAYNQLFQVCLNPKAAFQNEVDVIVLLFRLEDLLLDDLLAFLGGDADAVQRATRILDLLVSALRSLREGFYGAIIVNVPPYPSTLPTSATSLENSLGLGLLHRSLIIHFIGAVQKITGIHLCDLDAVQREVGLTKSFDSRQWYLYRQPFTDAFLIEAGALLARTIRALRLPPKKCVVLDCDNTLWGGVIGEDGLQGIELGDEFPGTAYRDFQRLLLYWHERGTLLALSSKNNESDVWEVFEKHPGMLLRQEHLSTWQINWQPKSEAMPKIAQALNIGIDSLVFLDDNPMEIDHLRQAWPEVQSFLVPEDPADILEAMRALTCFDRLNVTPEDRQRAGMIAIEQQRTRLSTSLSPEDFHRSLELKVDFFPAQPHDLERVAQLINKTNQFNLSTIRRSLDEVRELAKSPPHCIYGVRVSDKFGTYGLTGVVIAHLPPGKGDYVIDTFLLSCRVLGRGVETSLLNSLRAEANAAGRRVIVASFIPTGKNIPASRFLPDHGFLDKGNLLWCLDLKGNP